MTRETSPDIAALAGKYLGKTDEELHEIAMGSTDIWHDFRAICASALGQREPENASHESHLPTEVFTGWQYFPKSTYLMRACYDPVAKTLTAIFHDGTGFRYEMVPADIWTGLCTAESAGSYFHQNIRPFEGDRLYPREVEDLGQPLLPAPRNA